MKAKSDYIFLGLLGISLATTIIITISSDYTLTNFHYAAIAGWLTVLILRIFLPRTGRYTVGLLLLLGVFNVLNFFLIRTASSFGIGDLSAAGIDPYLFCVLVVYYIVNKRAINRIISSIFRENDKERADKQQKLIDFYLSQFKNSTPDELERALNKIKDYPTEAQIAMQQIQARN